MTTPGCKCIMYNTMPFLILCKYLQYICKGVELTWNYGSEAEEGMVYNTGNADTTGTGDGSKIRGGESVSS